MKYQAAIFDMDGVLVDSEYHWRKSELKLWNRLGVDANQEFQNKIIGLNLDGIAKILREEQNIEITGDELDKELEEDSREVYLKLCDLLPGTKDFLDKLRDSSVKLALASASPRSWVEMVLDRFELRNYFALTHSTRSDNIEPKPNPAVFLQTIEEMKSTPETTIIFEDSDHGVLAANRSKAITVLVKDGRWPTGDPQLADLTIKSFQDPKLIEFINE